MSETNTNGGHYNKILQDKIKLYQPLEKKQILLPDRASCMSVQAFLRMCNLKYTVEHKHNVEDISPSGQVPVLKCGGFVVSEMEGIVQFVEQNGVSLTKDLAELQKIELRAYISLVGFALAGAENYITWADRETYQNLTKIRFGSVYPWPLNWILVRRKQQQVLKKLNASGWMDKTIEGVFEEVDTYFNALSNKLDGKYFFGDRPTELDAMLFGHVFTILTTPLPKTQFAGIILSYPKITDHCQRIINEYFYDDNLSECTEQPDGIYNYTF